MPLVGLGEKGISIAKDSIQPQVPLRLPCYDFTPVKDPTVVCANKTTKSLCGTSGTYTEVMGDHWSDASGENNSQGVTGGVYRARVHIHRGMLIRDY